MKPKRGDFMAGNEKSGRKPNFAMSEAELEKHIEKYKEDVANGVIARASWPHFAATLDCTEKDLAEIMAIDESSQSAYTGRTKLLKKMLTWVRGQMLSSSGWNGQMTARAIFALKQDHGDGVVYRDKDMGGGGPSEVRVVFGGDDPRAKKAAK